MNTPSSDFVFSTPLNNKVSILGLSANGANLTSINVPENYGVYPIVSISANAFKGNTKLTSVDLSNTSIQVINSSAFYGNTNLTSLILPTSLMTIEADAFNHCNLLSLTFTQNLMTVNSNAFAYNERLSSIDMYNAPNNISIDLSAFTCSSDKAENLNVTLTEEQYSLYGTNGTFPDNGTLFNTHCFLEGTLILTPNGYKPIETLNKGDMVRTLHGDKPIEKRLEQPVFHDASLERNMNQLFSMNYPSVFQPLIVTGAHSTLVKPTPKEVELIKNMFKNGEEVVDDYCRLPAFLDEKASVYKVSGKYKVYHLMLEGGKFEGIFANGLLMESCVI